MIRLYKDNPTPLTTELKSTGKIRLYSDTQEKKKLEYQPTSLKPSIKEVFKTALGKIFGTIYKTTEKFDASKVLETVASKPLEKITAESKTGKVIAGLSKETSGTGILARIESLSPKKTYDDAYKAISESVKNPNSSTLNKFLYQLGNTLPQTAIGVALSFIPIAGKPLSAGYWSALSASEQLENKGKVSSITNIAIDTVGDMMLGKSIESLFKSGEKTLLNVMVKNFGVEGGTEVAQDLLKYQNNWRMAKTDEEKNAIMEEGKKYFTSGQILMTLGVGGVSGALIGGAGQIVGGKNISAVQQTTNIPQIETPETKQPKIRLYNEDGKKIIQGVKPAPTIAPEVKIAPPEAISPEKGIIPKELEPLAQEARILEDITIETPTIKRLYPNKPTIKPPIGEDVVLYHGSSSQNLRGIIESGLEPSSKKFNKAWQNTEEGWNNLARDSGLANKYALQSTRYGGEPIIIKLKTNWDNLRPDLQDWKFIEKSPKWKLEQKFIDPEYKNISPTTEDTFNVLGQVRQKGIIPVANIESIGRLEKGNYKFYPIEEYIKKFEPQLTDFYTQATKGIKEVKAEIKPIEITGNKPSGVALNIQVKAIEAGLTKGFKEIAEYTSTTFKEQADTIAELMNTNMEKAGKILTGEESLPSNIKSSFLLKTMADYAQKKGDIDLLMKAVNSPLATETSEAGSVLSLAREDNPYSAFYNIKEVNKVLEKETKQKTKKPKEKEINEMKEAIKKKTEKVSKYSWANFVKEISC